METNGEATVKTESNKGGIMIGGSDSRCSRRNLRRTIPRRMAETLLIVLFITITTGVTVQGQQLVPPSPKSPPSSTVNQSGSGQQQEEEEEFIKPSRPSLADPAEIQEAGVLQLEYGYDGNFRSDEFRSQQTGPLSLRFAATDRLLLQVSLDTFISEVSEAGEMRMTGVGDTRAGFQVIALKDTEKHPALAFAYFVKFPSASESKELGTGRFDHKVVGLVSKKVGQTDIDFNTALLVVGREGESGWETGGQAALSFAREFENNFGVQGEISGQSLDDVQPRGVFALGALTYKANRRLVFDAGMRFGLNPAAPRVGVFAGVTVGLANLYGK